MAELLEDTVARLTAFIGQNYTDIDVGPGSVINELLIKLAATLQNEQYNKIESLSQGKAITNVLASDEDSYSVIMDMVASNYNTSRSGGVKVAGKIKVIVSEGGDYQFDEGFIFTQPALNLNYLVAQDISVSQEPVASLNERQVYSDNGLWYFILDVVAEEADPKYQVSSGTAFIPELTINNFVKAEAYGNFLSGEAVETDKQLIAKIKRNLGNYRFESPIGIANRFRDTFPGFQYISVCGANDPEMTRSKQNLLGISTFGKADVYTRSSLGLQTKNVLKAATKITDTQWELRIANTDVPGFYNITSIIPFRTDINLGGTLLPSSIVYGFEGYPNQRNNEINSTVEARFTKYQTAVVVFEYDDDGKVPVGETAEFELMIKYQPNILEMQNMLLRDDERLACADYLIRAVIPCMVSLNINLLKKRPTDTYESLKLQKLKQDIFQYVNTIPFGQQLQASSIVDICHNYGIKRVDLPIKMTGRILCPDGSDINLEDADVLEIPERLDKGVTPKTTLYFIDYYRIENGITIPIDNIGLNIA
jgi:hypothetical protein